MKNKTLTFRNREVDIDDIDIIKTVKDGVIIRNNNGSLVFFRDDTKLNAIYKVLMSYGFRNFLQLKNLIINLDHIIEVSDFDNDELEFKIIFDKNEEMVELSSQEELFSVGLRLDKYRNQSVEI